MAPTTSDHVETTRRTLLKAGLLAGTAAVVPLAPGALPARAATRTLRRDPFTLGVASGDPSPDGFVLWTRLAPDPLADDGSGGMPANDYQVLWQVARDPRFADVVRSGAAVARPEFGHALHVELAGLEPGREYYYRFRQAVTCPAPAGR